MDTWNVRKKMRIESLLFLYLVENEDASLASSMMPNEVTKSINE